MVTNVNTLDLLTGAQIPSKKTTFLVNCTCGESAANLEFASGDEVPNNSLPFQAFIRVKESHMTTYCGGALISPTFVVTGQPDHY